MISYLMHRIIIININIHLLFYYQIQGMPYAADIYIANIVIPTRVSPIHLRTTAPPRTILSILFNGYISGALHLIWWREECMLIEPAYIHLTRELLPPSHYIPVRLRCIMPSYRTAKYQQPSERNYIADEECRRGKAIRRGYLNR